LVNKVYNTEISQYFANERDQSNDKVPDATLNDIYIASDYSRRIYGHIDGSISISTGSDGNCDCAFQVTNGVVWIVFRGVVTTDDIISSLCFY